MLLKELTALNGVSGNEDEVREYIKQQIAGYADEVSIDKVGNLIAVKRGKNPEYRIMLAAHMDEVGLMISGINEDGQLKFRTVGGIDERILPGKKVVVGDKKIVGVIGCKPCHLQDNEERIRNIKINSLTIDIGCEKRENAEKLVSPGDYIAFCSEYHEYGEEGIKAKALDDRVGCAILMELLKDRYDFDLYTCFTVQEEVGLRGAEVAAYNVSPDLAIVVEGTTCSDVPKVKEYEQSTLFGGGAVLTIMDRTAYADKGLLNFIYNTAVKKNIPVQFKKTTTGGNDAGKIQKSKSGVKVASVSVPCRYIHSPVSLMNRKDYESCARLLTAVLQEFDADSKILKSIINGGIDYV